MHVQYSPSELNALNPSRRTLPNPPPGYVWVYEADGLSGLGKFSLKKVVRAVTAPIRKVAEVAKKVVKSKVFKVAAIATAAFFAAPWAITLIKSVGTIAAQKIFAARSAGGVPGDVLEQETATNAVPEWAASAANVYIQNEKAKQAGEAALAAQRNQVEIDNRNAQLATERAKQEQLEYQAMQRAAQQQSIRDEAGAGYVETVDANGRPISTAKDKTPTWVLPAAIGGAALLLITSQ